MKRAVHLIQPLALIVTATLGLLLAAQPARAQLELEPTNAVYQTDQPVFRFDIGYRISPDDLRAPFYVRPEVRTAFSANQFRQPTLAPNKLPHSFLPFVTDIAAYIQKTAAHNNERLNGVSNVMLAAKIVRVAFCFGTDPYALTSQVLKESTFDQTRVSPTGAVGLTQMTSVAIDEVHDQLGSRGPGHANAENIPFIRQAIRCYAGRDGWKVMFEDGVLTQGETVNRKPRSSARAKAWLKQSVDRQLIYGQILLKVYLARARDAGLTGFKAYSAALRAFNGEKRGGHDVIYAKEIVTKMQLI